MRLLDPEGIQEPGDVVGPDLHVVVLERAVGLAVAAHVEVDTLNCFESSGVAGSKLKWPNPAPWIWTTGSPSPVILCHRLIPSTPIKPSTALPPS